MAKQRAVIIGAGMAGLAAALRLAESGRYEPVLVERETRPGGLARSLQLGEFTTDFGPHRIHSEDPQILAFIKDVAAPSLVTVRRSSQMLLGGGLLRYPPDPLGLAARLGPLRLARFAASFALERLRPPERPETYESLMRRAFGPALYEFLLRPYSAKTWKIDPAQLHADTARVRISAGNLTRMLKGLFGIERRGEQTSLKEFLYVRGGAETLACHLWERAAAAGARLETGCTATALELDEAGRVAALRADRTGESLRIPGDLFISTAPLPELLAEMLPREAAFLADAREAAAGLRYLDNTLVCLKLARPAVTADSWLYFPEADLIFNRGYEARAFDAAMAPAGRTLLTLEVTHRRGEAPGGLDDAALYQTVAEQLARTGLIRAEELERDPAGDPHAASCVHHIPFAYPLYTLDYDRRLERALAGLRSVANLITCGRQGLFNHNNMDHSIAMGLAAADAACSHGADEGTRRWYDGLARFKNLRIVD